MPESQYSHYKDMPRSELGVMANKTWLDDPKMLGIRLARYKFVAKMLAGKKTIAEIGCGDAWFTHLVEAEAKAVIWKYDLDETMSADYVKRHDIVKDGPLPFTAAYEHRFEAIYSLDCLEHIQPDDLPCALQHIAASMKEDGVFICGIPSLEGQKYASPASRAGHVSCLSGEQLRELMQGHFRNVFMFGMHDEVITTAFMPMAHYLIALCVGVK